MRNKALFLSLFLLHFTAFPMLRHAGKPSRPMAQRPRIPRVHASSRGSKPIYYQLNRFTGEACFKEPHPDIAYEQVGRHIYCQLLALQTLHYRHKHHSKVGSMGIVEDPQDKAQDKLYSAVAEFQKVFINPDETTNRFSGIYKEDYEHIDEQALIQAVKKAMHDFEQNILDPKNKI